MSDDSVRAALRSDAPLVVVEAPAGCGKTHQGAEYAKELTKVDNSQRLLILTHTHAACCVFAARTQNAARIDITTIDSMVASVAAAYHVGLRLPADIATWIRQRSDGHAELAVKVAALLRRHPMIAAACARRYPLLICDEHQDSSGDQHAAVMAMVNQGAKVRMFADPMQRIFRDKPVSGGAPSYDWPELTRQAQLFETLDVPHRWSAGCSELGSWTLAMREILKSGRRIDLRVRLPQSVSIVFAENQAQGPFDYRLTPEHRKLIATFEKVQSSLLVLTRYNKTARAIRALFFRRLPIWEGHTRPGLDKFVDALRFADRDPADVAKALVAFMDHVGKGFSPSAFGNRFIQEARDRCRKKATGKRAAIQQLARLVVDEPDHRGTAKVLQRLWGLRQDNPIFRDIDIDCSGEFWDAIRLGSFETPEEGIAEIAHRRAYARPSPPARAISTIHKAKGLECGSVILMPCDARTFPDKDDARCLLYVALSRATDRLQLVLSRSNPSPLFMCDNL